MPDAATAADLVAADLVINAIVKEYPTPTEPLRVLSGVSLALRRGENLAIVGPSGSGKSTLLSIIGTLEPPTSGTVRLVGEDPFALDEPELAAFRRRQIGFVFQDHHLLPQCTVLENVLVPFLADGVANSADRQHAEQLLDRVGLAQRLDAPAGGTFRRRTATRRDRPGFGPRADAALGRRADRQPRSHQCRIDHAVVVGIADRGEYDVDRRHA